jgi:hypothetical protein
MPARGECLIVLWNEGDYITALRIFDNRIARCRYWIDFRRLSSGPDLGFLI